VSCAYTNEYIYNLYMHSFLMLDKTTSEIILIISLYTISTFAGDQFQNEENFRNYVFIHDCYKDEKFEADLEAYSSWPKLVIRCPPYWWFYGKLFSSRLFNYH